jgi:hypothetical protein
MKRACIALLLTLFWAATVVAQDIPAVSFEHVTVGATAAGLSAGTIDPTTPGVGAVQYCRGIVETGDVRIRIDGTAPTATVLGDP